MIIQDYSMPERKSISNEGVRDLLRFGESEVLETTCRSDRGGQRSMKFVLVLHVGMVW